MLNEAPGLYLFKQPSSTRHHQSNAALSPTSHRLTNHETRPVTDQKRPETDHRAISASEDRLARHKYEKFIYHSTF